MIPRKPRPAVELMTRSLEVVARPADGFRPGVIVGITAKDESPAQLRRCLESVAGQTVPPSELGVVLVLDIAGHEAPEIPDVGPVLADRAWIMTAHCGNASRARNTLLHVVESQIPSARWVARLDADDRLADPGALGARRALLARAHCEPACGSQTLRSARCIRAMGPPCSATCRTSVLSSPPARLGLVAPQAPASRSGRQREPRMGPPLLRPRSVQLPQVVRHAVQRPLGADLLQAA